MKKTIYLLFIISLGLSVQSEAQVQSKAEIFGTQKYVQGLEAYENDEYERSIELLLQARQDLGSGSGINYALADSYLAKGDLPNAALYGKQAVAQSPSNKWFRFKLAQIYRSAGENQATLAELNTLLDYYPEDYDALFMLADTYKDYGEFLKSNEILDRALKLTGPQRSIYLQVQEFRENRS